MPKLYFEDFHPGDSSQYGDYEVTREAIVAFARQFDPQPLHLDDERARASLLEGLAASGWHTAAILMRINCDAFLLNSSSLGGPGIAELRWHKPVRPGHRLRVRRDILEARASLSRPHMGLVRMLCTVVEQSGEILMTQDMVIMFARRGAPPAPLANPHHTSPVEAAAIWTNPAQPAFFEDVVPGTRRILGQHLFSVPEIQKFAAAYDPQPFHLDQAEARLSNFGGLVASGWHTAGAWMRLMVDDRLSAKAAPDLGPSPGVRDLKWSKPVFAGDRITFETKVIAKRPTSRPGWGLVVSHNTGVNQNQTCVFEFTGAVFWPMRGEDSMPVELQ